MSDLRGWCLVMAVIGATLLGGAPCRDIVWAVEAKPREIQATYDRVRDLSADFVHTIRFPEFESRSVSSGRFFFKRGTGNGKMRWDYEKPQSSQIFIDGESVLHYSPENRQVMKSRLQMAPSLPLRLLSGGGRLDRDFQVATDEAPDTLRLTPKEKIAGIAQIKARIVPFPPLNGLILKEVVLHEDNGNVVIFSFEKIRANQDLADDLFRFTLPDGVEVIESP